MLQSGVSATHHLYLDFIHRLFFLLLLLVTFSLLTFLLGMGGGYMSTSKPDYFTFSVYALTQTEENYLPLKTLFLSFFRLSAGS